MDSFARAEDAYYAKLEYQAEQAMWGDMERKQEEINEKIDESIESDEVFPELLTDWADWDVVISTLRGMCLALENRNEKSALVFAKSFLNELRYAAETRIIRRGK